MTGLLTDGESNSGSEAVTSEAPEIDSSKLCTPYILSLGLSDSTGESSEPSG